MAVTGGKQTARLAAAAILAVIAVGSLAPTSSAWAATPCCAIVANAALKGQMGRLVLAFPKDVEYRFSSVEIVPAAGGKAMKYYGAKTLDLAPGRYDVAVTGARVADVMVTAGHETHVLAGGLRVAAAAATRVEVWDASRSKMLRFAIGNAVLGLPVGHYAVKVGQGAGTFTDVTVEDGKVATFEAVASRPPVGAAGLAAASSAGVTCSAAGKAGSYLAPDAKIRGVCSPASDNPNNEPDPVPAGVPQQHSVGAATVAGPITTRRLASTNDGKQIIEKAVQRLGGFQIHLALLGGHTYMVSDCLGIKASAGTFDFVVPPPSLTFGATSATISFGVGHIGLDAFTVRLRPDPTDALQPCHFSGRIGIGGSVDDVKFSMTVDPLYDLETCEVMALNVSNAGWSIGSFRLAPLPPPVTGVAKEMVVDAMDYYTGFGLQDKFIEHLSEQLTPNHVIASTVCKNLH